MGQPKKDESLEDLLWNVRHRDDERSLAPVVDLLCYILKVLVDIKKLVGDLTPPPKPKPVRGVLTINGKEWLTMQTLKDTEVKTVSVKWLDALGNETVQDSQTFELADPNTCTLEVAADGKSAVLKPIQEPGKLGNGQVKVTGTTAGSDPDLALGDYEVVAGEAVSGQVIFQ